MNLSKREARSIGAAVGCDFFVTAKLDASLRSEQPGKSHWEALIALLVVDGRGGALVLSDLVVGRGDSRDPATAAALATLDSRLHDHIDKLITFHGERTAVSRPKTEQEIVYELPGEGANEAEGFTPPEFLNRVKPVYTENADRLGIAATVEAMVVFRANGEIGEIEITRWAGFGLDESAADAIRKLKFKPATKEGKQISIRGLIRYNFRRTASNRPVAELRTEQACEAIKYFWRR
jgi:TonB family protein